MPSSTGATRPAATCAPSSHRRGSSAPSASCTVLRLSSTATTSRPCCRTSSTPWSGSSRRRPSRLSRPDTGGACPRPIRSDCEGSNQRRLKALGLDGGPDRGPDKHPLRKRTEGRDGAWRTSHAAPPANDERQEKVGRREAVAEEPRPLPDLVGDDVEHAREPLLGARLHERNGGGRTDVAVGGEVREKRRLHRVGEVHHPFIELRPLVRPDRRGEPR